MTERNRSLFLYLDAVREEANSIMKQNEELIAEITRLKAELKTAWEAGRDDAAEETTKSKYKNTADAYYAIRNLKRPQDGEKL